MAVFFRIGKQRYCQGLPLLASLTVVAGDANQLIDGALLEPLEAETGPARPLTTTEFSWNYGCATSFFEMDTNEIPEGAYSLIAADGSAVSGSVMILTKATYEQLLEAENGETFDEETILATNVYRFVENIIAECWTRVESIPALLADRVVRGGFHPSLTVTGQVEATDRQISLAKVRYGSEAILSDLAYLAATPAQDNSRSGPSALDLRIDHRGNLLLYARTEVGITRPDRVLEAMRSYSDLAALKHFHPEYSHQK